MPSTISKLRCPECSREFMLEEDDVEDDLVTCPHCRADVPVDDED